MQPAVFLDRDGVLIENRSDYVKHWSEVQFLPGAFRAMQRLGNLPCRIVIITNQSAIGRGILDMQEAWDLHSKIEREIVAQGGRIDASYLCPHSPEARCSCRKPAPGLLLQAEHALSIDMGASYLIGDAATDIQAAQAVGVEGVMVLTGRGQEQRPLLEQTKIDCRIVSDLDAAVDYLLTQFTPMPDDLHNQHR